MSVVCHSYTSDHALKYCAAMLLENQMYEQSGLLQTLLVQIAKTGKASRCRVLMIVAWAGVNLDKPVGCLLYFVGKSSAQFYVKPTQRRKGIASRLLKRLRGMENYGNRVIEAVQGYPGSLEFFDKHFVYVPDDSFSEAELELVAKEIRAKTEDLMIQRWRSIRVIQQRRKHAFFQKYKAAKKAGLI